MKFASLDARTRDTGFGGIGRIVLAVVPPSAEVSCFFFITPLRFAGAAFFQLLIGTRYCASIRRHSSAALPNQGDASKSKSVGTRCCASGSGAPPPHRVWLASSFSGSHSPVVNHDLPQRHTPAKGVHLSLGGPNWVFLTVCTEQRERWLIQPSVQRALEDIWKNTATAWLVSDYLLMPDHLHLFCAPRDLKFTIERWIGFWKDQFAKKFPVGTRCRASANGVETRCRASGGGGRNAALPRSSNRRRQISARRLSSSSAG